MKTNSSSIGNNRMKIRWFCTAGISTARCLLGLVIGLSVLVLFGCGQKAHRVIGGRRTPKAAQVSKEELRKALNSFEEYAAAKNSQVANELDRLFPNLKARKANLIRKTRLRQAFRTMLDHEDPIIAFIETWGLCVRVGYYLREGDGAGLYGEYQSLAADSWQEIEDRIERIGRQFLDEDIYAETRDNIHDFARANPIRGTFGNLVVYATEVKPGQAGAFETVVGIPMAPFSAMKGVDRAALAIYGVQGSVERFSDIVEELPEAAQWQMLMLLMEMEEIEAVKSVLTSMSQVSDSSVKFVDAAEKLPERLREQTSILVKEIDAGQANIQATLDKTQQTSAAIEQTLAEFKAAVGTLQQTSSSITETAAAWESAANATGQVVREVSSLLPEKEDTVSEAGKGDDRDTIQEVGIAANELHALATEVRDLLESGTLAAHIEDVNDRVVGVVGQSTIYARSLADHVTWRMMQLLALVFVLVLVYRVIAVRFVAKRKQ